MNNKEELQKQFEVLTKEIVLTESLLKEKKDKRDLIINKLKLTKDDEEFKKYIGKCYLDCCNVYNYTIFKIMGIKTDQNFALNFILAEINKDHQDYNISFYNYGVDDFVANQLYFKEISKDDFDSTYAKIIKEITEKIKVNN